MGAPTSGRCEGKSTLPAGSPSGEKTSARTGSVSGPQTSTGPACGDSGSTSHRRTVRSWLPDAGRMSAREGPSSVYMRSRCTRGFPPTADPCTGARGAGAPVGWNSRAWTAPRCAVNSRQRRPAVRSHTWIAPESEPVATQRPSGEKRTWLMAPACALYVWMHPLRRRSHNFTCVSWEPDATNSLEARGGEASDDGEGGESGAGYRRQGYSGHPKGWKSMAQHEVR